MYIYIYIYTYIILNVTGELPDLQVLPQPCFIKNKTDKIDNDGNNNNNKVTIMIIIMIKIILIKIKTAVALWLRCWIPNPGILDSKPLSGFKVNSVFHLFEVDQFSTRN